MDLPRRKQIRLRTYDYSAPGAYFVTICTHERRCILSDIAVGEGRAPPGKTARPCGENSRLTGQNASVMMCSIQRR